MMLLDMKKQHAEAAVHAEKIVKAAESGQRDFTAEEMTLLDAYNKTMDALAPQIAAIQDNNTLAGQFDAKGPKAFYGAASRASLPVPHGSQSPGYASAFHAWLSSKGNDVRDELHSGSDGTGGFVLPGSERFTQQRRANGLSAALYESGNSAGGYAVSVPTVQQFVPLAMPDLGIFDASMVISTASDIKIPQAASFGTSALKSESTGTLATFGGSDPTIGQITLSAFMAGAIRWASWEALEDIPTFQSFIVEDLIKGQRILEGSLLATGSGSGQALGVFGNTGTGTASAYELLGTSADAQTLLDSLFDVTATLKGQYQANACWVMSRATGMAIRRAQMQTNLFASVATTDPDGTERILGRPVFYDVNAPALPTATNAGVVPILFGDFKQGYIIGVRGGGGINVKILDQPMAVDGQLGILAYRRMDGRVRRSEAIQGISISHS